VERGLPLAAVERLAKLIDREDSQVLHALLSRSTIARVRRKQRPVLTKEMSERVYDIARVFGTALDVWHGDTDASVRFLNRPHPLLDRRTPFDVAKESTAGANLVVEILGAGQAGVAV
jgi:putative toxin-antitoxin system antitoxin component (TIGR02293 family)